MPTSAKEGASFALNAVLKPEYEFVGFGIGDDFYDAQPVTLTMGTSNIEVNIFVNIKQQEQQYSITAQTVEGASVYLNGVTSAKAGAVITFSINVDNGYTLNGVTVVDASGTALSVNGPDASLSYSFTMPASNVVITPNVTNNASQEKTLESISLSGYTTNYYVNDRFVFDGVVTALYSDRSTAVVTPTSVSNPDMTSAGRKQVTVTYVEGRVEKTASYYIVVSERQESKLSGTYLFNKKLAGVNNQFYLVFNDDGAGQFIREVAGDNGAVNRYGLNFTFTADMNSKTFSVSFVSYFEGTSGNSALEITNCFGSRYLFNYKDGLTVNRSGKINDDGSLYIDLFASGSSTANKDASFIKQ